MIAVAGLVAVGVLATAVAIGSGGPNGERDVGAASLDLGRFAGYAQVGPTVRSVSATLIVPSATTANRNGEAAASTWIGAQTLPNDSRSPFIQVGVEEIPVTPRLASYSVFWSDTAHHDFPIVLFQASAGDRVSVRLIHSRDRWTVVVSDGPVRRRIVTVEDGVGEFRLALWFQEDLGAEHPKQAVYPRLVGLRVSNLTVNGIAPRPVNLSPVWMSADPEYAAAAKELIEPSAVRNDAFTLLAGRRIVPASVLSSLDALGRRNQSVYKTQQRLAMAAAKLPRAKLAIWVSDMSTALRGFAETLRKRAWGHEAKASVNELTSTLHVQQSLAQERLRVTMSELESWQRRWEASIAEMEVALARLLDALHLPVTPVLG